MGRWGRIAAALLTVVTPASVFAIAGPASAVVAPTNVGNTGNSTQSYIDRQIVADSSGFAYLRSTPGFRSQAWEGFPNGALSPSALTGIPSTDFVVGVEGGLAVASDFNGNVAWENLNGTGAGTGTAIPSGNTTYTADPSSTEVSTAPGGWVVIGDTIATPTTAHLLQVSTTGTVTDLLSLGTVPSADSWTFQAGPNGVVYQTFTTATSTSSAWSYVPYASPHTPVPLASDTNADNCERVFSADAICLQNTATTPIDVLVPLDGSADTSITTPSTATFVTGTSSDAAWLNLPGGTISFQPWNSGSVTTVSTGAAIPAGEMVSDGSNLIFGADATTAISGIGEITPPGTQVTSIQSEPITATEASGVALTPGRVSWTDDHPATSTLAAGAGPLWDRTLTNGSGTLTAGASPNLVVTDASAYSLSAPAQIDISGRRTLYTNNAKNLVLHDPAASTTESVFGATSASQATVSGSRVLWFDNPAGKWKLRDLNTGSDADLSATIGNFDSATLWGNYIAFEKNSDESVWRWDISNLSNPPVEALASPQSTTLSCFPEYGPFVAGDYVAWSEGCFDSNTHNFTPVSGYRNVTADSTPVDLSSNGFVVALSGSYVATVPGSVGSGLAAQTITATRLGTATTASPGSATGPVALDGSTAAWIDDVGDVQAESLPYVAEQPRYLGNGAAPTSLALPGTWKGEWDTSGALSSCTVNITRSSTTVATLPCDSTDMALGEAVVSWNGTGSGGSQVNPGSYTWTLSAAGPDGALLAPDGSPLTLSGSISVNVPVPTSATTVAFQANGGSLWSISPSGSTNWGVGMAPNTNPSVMRVGTSGCEIAFQAYGGALWTVGNAGWTNWGVGMAPGTSPSMVRLSNGGYEIAFQAAGGTLWTVGTAGWTDWHLGMAPGTSPSVVALPNGGYEVAFQAAGGTLWTVGTAGWTAWNLGMAPGTSPSAFAPSSGGFEVGFQAAGGALWTVGSAGWTNWNVGMAPGTSPATVRLSNGGYELGFQASGGGLWTVGTAGWSDWGLGMAATSSPALAALPNGGFEVAFQANGGHLWTVGSAGWTDWPLGMGPGTSPSGI